MVEVYAHPIGTPGASISSAFGSRIHPVTGQYQSLHAGVDFPAPEGTPVYALSSGTVSKTGSDATSGNYVEINHAQLFATSYLHLSSIAVQPGQTVTAGTMIGRVGSTGRVTGAHLHFGVKRGGVPVDPMPYVTIAVLPELARNAASTAKAVAVNYWWVVPIVGVVAYLLLFRRDDTTEA
jgi:murein DD-endopeptidase MepM/ murein hydrolase activator NlpD